MFNGVTLATVMADASTILTDFAPIIGVVVAFWGGNKVVRVVKKFIGG